MANPTTNYGFVLPTATDLVTDLPADFDVALQGVDTRLKALQPGTTLGDIAYSSATANTNTRLGIGSTGQILTVASGVPTWATPASGASFTGVGVTKSASQSTANATFVAITWNTEDFDTSGYHDTATNNTRITIPTGKGGYYLITGIVQYDGNGTKNRAGELRKNGTALNYLYFLAAAEVTNSPVYQMSFIVNLAAADYVEIFSYQNSGGALNIDNYSTKWQMQYLGA